MYRFMQSLIGKEKLAFGAAIFAGIMRLVPHPGNFTPVGGLAIYSGARLSGWRAFATPLLVWITTGFILAFIGGYSFFSIPTVLVLASFVVYILLGRLVRNTENPLAIGGVSVAGSVQFFLLTNLGIWAFGGIYPLTAVGLSTCFVAALPFFGATLMGDLVYTGALFTAHHFLARSYFPEEAVASA